MADREKVLHGLDSCSTDYGVPNICELTECPYRGNGPACVHMLAGDALSLLKAQQPRVMTMEGLYDLRGRGQAVYYQDRDATAKSQDAFYVGIDLGVAWFKGETYTFCKSVDGYGEDWRCWTSRPTDEQRKAVKWDG